MAFYLTADQPHVRLKSYGANVKGKTAVLTVTVEVTDTFELSFLLRGLEELKAAPRPARAASSDLFPGSQAKRPRQRKLEHKPMLALPPPWRDGSGDGA